MQNVRDVEQKCERLARIHSQLIGAGAQVLTNMPHSPNVNADRIGEIFVRQEELKNEIQSIIDYQKKERNFFGKALNIMPKNEKMIICKRYFSQERWNDICDMIFGSSDNLYMRKIYRLHNKALQILTKTVNKIYAE